VPVAVTEKVTESPTHLVALTGLALIEGRGFTVSVAAVEFETHPLEVVTTQS
jgi:hypothetical protein